MRLLRLLGWFAAALLVVVGSGYVWASATSARVLDREYAAHEVEFPIPYPLQGEVPADADVEGLAWTRAVERGGRLLDARYGCRGCHGEDLGGEVLLDNPMLGSLWAPNLTLGEGSATRDFTPADWDRAVRHGLRQDGTAAMMPAFEFKRMTDQELSDIVAFIRSRPAVDRTVPERKLGPVLRTLLAAGKIELTPDMVPLDEDHAVLPPDPAVTLEFGGHMAATCAGCHRVDFNGGPVTGADPGWPIAANLTPHAEGLAAWTAEDFRRALREGVRPDGTPLREPMTHVLAATRAMSDTEVDAMWMYLQSLEPVATGR